MGYDPSKLTLCGQAIAGPKKWVYEDTGGETAAVYQGAGYFTDAYNRGVSVGDPIEVLNRSSNIAYFGRFTTVQDTGETSGTVNLDTGATG